MKRNIIFKFIILALITVFTACDDDQNDFLDLNNLDNSIAVFAPDNVITFNPVENVDNIIRVGVSTISNSDRTFVLSLDEDSSLDSQFFNISSLTGVIPAGSFFGSIVVTTLGGEVDILPAAASDIILNIESVEGAIVEVSSTDLNVSIACPSTDITLIPGNYNVTASTFANFFGETDFTREIVAGPGENQFTIIDGSYPNDGSDDLIFTVNPETGAITAVDETLNASVNSFGPNGYVLRSGSRVLTCAGIIELNLDFGGSIAGNPFVFNLVLQ